MHQFVSNKTFKRAGRRGAPWIGRLTRASQPVLLKAKEVLPPLPDQFMSYKIIKLSTKVILDLKNKLFWRPKMDDLCLLLL